MKRSTHLLVLILLASLTIVGCSQAAPTSSVQAPSGASKAAEPTKASAVVLAPTQASAAAPTKAPAPQPTAVPASKVDFPQKGKAITIIVPFAAGGSTDIAGRMLAPIMEKVLGTSVQVLNEAGASSQVGLTHLATSKPDGYTLCFFVNTTSNPIYLDPERKAAFARKDLQAVANFFAEDDVLSVNSTSPYKSLKDFVDAAKANPGQIKVGTSGIMALGHQAMLEFQQLAGVKFAYVHFDGSAPALAALLGGHIDALCSGAGNVGAHFKQGTVRTLGIMERQESPFFPGVKTFEQQGYTIAAPVAYGLVVPAGTPKEIVAMESAAIKKAAEDPEVIKKLAEFGISTRYMDTAEYEAYWAARDEKVKTVIQLAKEN